MRCLLRFVTIYVLPFAAGLVVAVVLMILVLIARPAHGAEAIPVRCSVGIDSSGSLARCVFASAGGASVGSSGTYEYSPPEAKLRWGGADWEPRHSAAAIIELLARYYDVQQTRACLTVYPACYESGMMGVHGDNPSAAQLYRYGLAVWSIDQFVAYQLDAPLRDVWQWLRIAEVGITIKRNHDVHEKFGDQLPKPDFPAGLLVLVVVPFFF